MTARRLILLVGLLWFAPVQVVAADIVPRKIIALYDSVRNTNARLSPAHRLAAMPLNWLGLTVTFHDVRKGLPPVWDDPDVRGVLTFFSSPGVKDPQGCLDWAERVIQSGRKFVILGSIGATEDLQGRPTPIDRVQHFMALLGIRYEGGWSAVTYDARIVDRNPTMMEFERKFGELLPPFEMFEPVDATVESFLTIIRPGLDRPSHLALLSPAGGFVAEGYTHFRDLASNFTQWYLNPFAFFERAFGLQGLPRPDVTTLAGRRIFYSHIDGDGWRNVSTVTKYYRDRILSAEVALRELIAPFPDLPVTVAPIAADLDPDWVGTVRAQRVARELFALRHVEAASHTYSHPFQWSFFEHYTTEKERPFLPRYDAGAGGVYVFELGNEEENEAADEALVEGDKLKAGYVVPRAYANKPFDLDNEIAGAFDYIARFAPVDRPPRLLQWSGDTSPFLTALQAVTEHGAANINGGDSRYDADYPSVSWLAPIGRPVEDTLHIYASASNENTYTDLWTARYFGYRDLATTLENTEHPRRLKPINLYYHIYSAEKQAALRAVLDNIAYARGQTICPITATDFARIGEGFFATRFEALAPGRWQVRERGPLQTVRFDRAEGLSVDFAASTGVLGATRHEGSLYFALDPAAPAPIVAIGPRNDDPPPRPVLESSRWPVSGFTATSDGFSFVAGGFGPGDMVWRVPTPGRWQAKLAGDHPPAVATVGADRRLVLRLPAGTETPSPVSLIRLGD
jgi:hypothetical protein